MSNPNHDSSLSVLTIGGIDPSGGAGVLVDAAAIRSLGLHPSAVVAVTTVQTGSEFIASKPQDMDIVRKSVETLLCAFEFGAVKTGALASTDIVKLVATFAMSKLFPPLVVDPVFRSTSGGTLLDFKGVSALKGELIPRAKVVTPNLEEASVLAGMNVGNVEQMRDASLRILELGCEAVLIKGGHLKGKTNVDVIVDRDGKTLLLESERLDVGEVRGTGCALASLIAGNIALGKGIFEAAEAAKEKLSASIRNSVKVSRETGPRVLTF